eukprot:841158-Pyramimonas_sp.AAC.1
MDIVDRKVVRYHRPWHSGVTTWDGVLATMETIRSRAQVGQLVPLEIPDVRAALSRMKARAGLGIDRLSPTDMERLPDGHGGIARRGHPEPLRPSAWSRRASPGRGRSCAWSGSCSARSRAAIAS